MNGKDEIKIALVMDDYKVKNKEDLWRRSLATRPDIERDYVFDREEMHPGLTKNTTTSIRYFKKKAIAK